MKKRNEKTEYLLYSKINGIRRDKQENEETEMKRIDPNKKRRILFASYTQKKIWNSIVNFNWILFFSLFCFVVVDIQYMHRIQWWWMWIILFCWQTDNWLLLLLWLLWIQVNEKIKTLQEFTSLPSHSNTKQMNDDHQLLLLSLLLLLWNIEFSNWFYEYLSSKWILFF